MIDYLYKYRNWTNDDHKRMITRNEIYFSSPVHFNDPYDCRIPVRFDKLTRDQHIEFAKPVIRKHRPNLNEIEISQLAQKIVDDGIKKDPLLFEKHRAMILKKWETDFGICTMTTKFNNIVMWSHYAGKHKGFVVGFNYQLLYKSRERKEFLDRRFLFDIYNTI